MVRVLVLVGVLSGCPQVGGPDVCPPTGPCGYQSREEFKRAAARDSQNEPHAPSPGELPSVVARDAGPDAVWERSASEQAAADIALVTSEIPVTPETKEASNEPDKGSAQDQTEYENGVAVFYVNKHYWCATEGRAAEVCWDNAAICRARSPGCEQRDAWACFLATIRTTGEQAMFCLSSFGKCDRLRESAESNRETADVSSCSIVRYRKGATKR